MRKLRSWERTHRLNFAGTASLEAALVSRDENGGSRAELVRFCTSGSPWRRRRVPDWRDWDMHSAREEKKAASRQNKNYVPEADEKILEARCNHCAACCGRCCKWKSESVRVRVKRKRWTWKSVDGWDADVDAARLRTDEWAMGMGGWNGAAKQLRRQCWPQQSTTMPSRICWCCYCARGRSTFASRLQWWPRCQNRRCSWLQLLQVLFWCSSLTLSLSLLRASVLLGLLGLLGLIGGSQCCCFSASQTYSPANHNPVFPTPAPNPNRAGWAWAPLRLNRTASQLECFNAFQIRNRQAQVLVAVLAAATRTGKPRGWQSFCTGSTRTLGVDNAQLYRQSRWSKRSKIKYRWYLCAQINWPIDLVTARRNLFFCCLCSSVLSSGGLCPCFMVP